MSFDYHVIYDVLFIVDIHELIHYYIIIVITQRGFHMTDDRKLYSEC